jgi:hypothetical protein
VFVGAVSGALEVQPVRTNAEEMTITAAIQICREIRVGILATSTRLLDWALTAVVIRWTYSVIYRTRADG